jgi:hypothetical protein
MQAHTDSRHSLSILPSHSLAGYVADTAIIPFKYQALACDNPHLSTCTPTLKIADTTDGNSWRKHKADMFLLLAGC